MTLRKPDPRVEPVADVEGMPDLMQCLDCGAHNFGHGEIRHFKNCEPGSADIALQDWYDDECKACLDPDFMPGHMGSRGCKSGSLASGGNRSHCTCDTCF